MLVDWGAIAQVGLVSLLFGGGIAVVFAFGVAALSRRAVATEAGRGAPPLDTAVAGLCFLACAAAVLFGLYLIVPQFH